MASPMTCSPQIVQNNSPDPSNSSEQLHLPIHDEVHGIPPFRLLEPINSLRLTPFAAKAARGIGASTVGDLAAFVFDPAKDCRSLGQGHIEEIRRKIELFAGKPPYQPELRFDFASLLRLSLSEIESNQKAIIVAYCELQQVIPLSSQESREAENSLAKDKEKKFLQTVEAARRKNGAKIPSLLEMVFHGLVRPWMTKRGGAAHEREITMFLFEAQQECLEPSAIPSEQPAASAAMTSSEEKVTVFSGQREEEVSFLDYPLFEKGLSLLSLIANSPFLFSGHVCHVDGKVWALTLQDKARALAILQDAAMLIGKGKEGTSLKALAKAVEECRFEQWDPCAYASIERLLFWHFLYR
jgi:hypothetical protein